MLGFHLKTGELLGGGRVHPFAGGGPLPVFKLAFGFDL